MSGSQYGNYYVTSLGLSELQMTFNLSELTTDKNVWLMIGKENLDRRDELTLELARRHVEVLTATREGKRRATNPDTTREDALLSALNHYLEPSTEV